MDCTSICFLTVKVSDWTIKVHDVTVNVHDWTAYVHDVTSKVTDMTIKVQVDEKSLNAKEPIAIATSIS